MKYLDIEILKKIESKIPNLTIFVPELPDNIFSAELWNVDSEIPVVAVRDIGTIGVPIFYSDGREDVIKPSFFFSTANGISCFG